MNAIALSRGRIIAFAAIALTALSACGNSQSDQTATQPSAPAAAPTEQTKAAPSPAASPTPATTAPSTEAPTEKPAQVSETGDDSETVEATAPTSSGTPTLKLAGGGLPETKGSSQFKEGVHYQRLVPTQPTNTSPGQVEVLEVFWYGCPHCFALDSKLEAWRAKGRANYVAFQRLPATWNDATLFHGRLFYVAEQLGKLEALHTPIFREIHLNGNPLNTPEKARAFFAAHGVGKADFDKAFESFSVNTKIQTASLLNRRYRVEGVPFFVVNGKYTFDIGTAGGEDQVLQLINELAAREHR